MLDTEAAPHICDYHPIPACGMSLIHHSLDFQSCHTSVTIALSLHATLASSTVPWLCALVTSHLPPTQHLWRSHTVWPSPHPCMLHKHVPNFIALCYGVTSHLHTAQHLWWSHTSATSHSCSRYHVHGPMIHVGSMNTPSMCVYYFLLLTAFNSYHWLFWWSYAAGV